MLSKRDDEQYKIRLPEGMRDRVKSAADANNRSMNAEIVARLEASFDVPVALHSEIARLIEDHVQRQVATHLMRVATALKGAA